MAIIEKIQRLESIINEKLKESNIQINIIGKENKGKIIISKEKRTDKVLDIYAISSCQIDILENNKIIERGIFIDNIGAWIFNLYNEIEYAYVFYGGRLNHQILTREQLNEKTDLTTPDMSFERKQGAVVHRKELDNQPIVEGYLGPMFEEIDYGKIYLRYETQEIYDMLSA